MTAFARKVLAGCPAPTSSGAANNYQILQEFTNDNDKYDGKLDYQFSPALTCLRPLRLAQRGHLRPAAAAAALGRRRQRHHLRHATSSSPPASPGPDRATSAARVPLRLVAARVAGKNPPALGTPSAQDAYGITGLPTDPRVAGGLPTQLITRLLRPRPPGHQPAVAVPDGLQPEAQLHPQRRAALAEDRATSSSTSRPRCRTSTRSTAATPTRASSAGRPAPPPTTSTTWPTSCSACAASTR